ncbi:mucin 5B, oligomeric mucus gel-forming [Xylographa opegraphella]|nr:mucin 5B, oligomeric mucus gel-forming [Xylographa opegraphella]
MSLSRTGTITTVLLFASVVYAGDTLPASTTTNPSVLPSFLSLSNSSLSGSSYTPGSLFSSSSTLVSFIPSSDPSLPSTTLVPRPLSSSSLISDYSLSGETLTETITWLITGSETVTYDLYENVDTPTLTITGPFTSTETKTVTTQVIATNPNATFSTLPPWDPVPYLDYFAWPYPSAEPSLAAVLSSFTSYGRQPECTVAYNAFKATDPIATKTYAVDIITTTLPGDQVTDTSPSIYVAFPTVSAVDGCGLVGPPVTSLTLAFAPGELSTIANQNPGPGVRTSLAFDPADMPCGPHSGANGFLPSAANLSSYLPIIALPSKLVSYRPDWASLGCDNDIWQGQDPPYALTAQSPVVPASSPALVVTQDPPVPATTRAVPASTWASPAVSTSVMQLATASQLVPLQEPSSLPSAYGRPGPSSLPDMMSSGTPAAGSPNKDPGTSSTDINIESSGPSPVVLGGQSLSFTAATPLALPTVVQAQHPPGPIVAGGFTFTLAPAVPSAPIVPIAPVPTSAVSVNGQDPTPGPASSGAIVFDGQTPTQAAGATTIDNIPIVLSSGSIFLNGQGIAIPTLPTTHGLDSNSPLPPVSVINPPTLIRGSQTLTPGQPTATPSNLPVALGSAGLVIGGTTTTPLGSLLAPLTSAPSPPGTSLIASGPTLTVSGTRLSLALIIGTSTILLPLAPSTISTTSETIALAPPSSDILLILGSDTLTLTLNAPPPSLATRTYAPAPPIPTTAGGSLGAAITSAFGTTPSPTAPPSEHPSTAGSGTHPLENASSSTSSASHLRAAAMLAALSCVLLGRGGLGRAG